MHTKTPFKVNLKKKFLMLLMLANTKSTQFMMKQNPVSPRTASWNVGSDLK